MGVSSECRSAGSCSAGVCGGQYQMPLRNPIWQHRLGSSCHTHASSGIFTLWTNVSDELAEMSNRLIMVVFLVLGNMSPTPGKNRDHPNSHGEEGDINLGEADLPAVIAASSSSGSDAEDDQGHHGYQLLPQEPGGPVNEDDVEMEEEAQEIPAGDSTEMASGQAFHLENCSSEKEQSSNIPFYMQVCTEYIKVVICC